jgi:hypothetical protein
MAKNTDESPFVNESRFEKEPEPGKPNRIRYLSYQIDLYKSIHCCVFVEGIHVITMHTHLMPFFHPLVKTFLFFYFFDISAQKVKGFELVTSILLDMVPTD